MSVLKTVYAVTLLSSLLHVGFGGAKVTMSLFAVDLGASAATIGLMVSLLSFFPMFLALPAGRIADRTGVRMPMLAGSLSVALAIAVPGIWPTMTALYVATAAIGIAFMFYQVGAQNLAGSIGRPEDRTRNFSILSLGYAAASFVGPLIAGFSIDLLGHRWAFAVLTVPPAIACIALIFARSLVPNTHSKAAAGARGGGLMDLFKQKTLRDTYIAGGILSSAWDLYQFFMPLYGRSIGLSASAIGMILATFAVAIFAVRALIPMLARRYTETELITTAIFVACAAYMVFGFADGPWLLAVGSIVLGLGVGAGQPLAMTLIFNLAPKGREGEASGVRVTMNNVTHVTVPIAFGTLGAVIGFAPLLLANGVLLACCAMYSRRNYGRR